MVPKFSGKIEHWVSFWEEFSHAVDQKPEIDEATKMIYLKQAMLDQWLKATIGDLGISEGAYEKSKELLQDRFNRPMVIHRQMCEALKTITPNIHTRASLTELADKAQHILTGLMKLKSKGASEIITSMLELIMGKELRHQWHTYTDAMLTTHPAEKIIAFIRNKAYQIEGEDPTSQTKPHFEKGKNHRSNQHRSRGSSNSASGSSAATSATVAPSVSTPASQPAKVASSQPAKPDYFPCKYSCPLCSENHYPYHCSVFKGYTPAQRKEHVQAHSLCRNCLKAGHTPETCRSTYKCKTCRGQHNSLLHEDEARVASPVLGLSSVAAAAVRDGLVMTANVLVTGTNGITTVARAFLDSGSTVSLVSNRLRKTLALKSSGGSLFVSMG